MNGTPTPGAARFGPRSEPAEHERSATGEVALSARDLSVELGGLPVLRGIDLEVRTGEAVALLGGNGSGKSTLVRALLGLVPLKRGSAEIFGTPVRSFRSWSRVGYVPQRSPATLGGAKVKEVVAQGRLARRRPFQPPTRMDRTAVRIALQQVGMAGRANDDIGDLSGGQQQRVLIARAIAGQPDLLVLDEPIAGVDLEQQRVVADLLGGLLGAGATVLIVLHETGPIEGLLSRAVVLSEGRVARQGSLADMLGVAGHPVGGHEFGEPDSLHRPSGSGLSGTVER